MSYALFAIGLTACTAVVVTLCQRSPIREDFPDEEPTRVQRDLAYAAHLRDQLAGVYERMCEAHGYEPLSHEADVLMSVVYDGEDYCEAMASVMEYRYGA